MSFRNVTKACLLDHDDSDSRIFEPLVRYVKKGKTASHGDGALAQAHLPIFPLGRNEYDCASAPELELNGENEWKPTSQPKSSGLLFAKNGDSEQSGLKGVGYKSATSSGSTNIELGDGNGNRLPQPTGSGSRLVGVQKILSGNSLNVVVAIVALALILIFVLGRDLYNCKEAAKAAKAAAPFRG